MADEQGNASAVPDSDAATRDALVIEKYKADREDQLEKYRVGNQFWIEGTKAINVAGQAAMRAAMIINGAAAIALLAFLGNSDAEPGLIPWAMLAYLGGVVTAAIASGCAYLAMFRASAHQDTDAQHKAFTPGNNAAIVLTGIAYFTFVAAGFIAFLHFKGGSRPPAAAEIIQISAVADGNSRQTIYRLLSDGVIEYNSQACGPHASDWCGWQDVPEVPAP